MASKLRLKLSKLWENPSFKTVLEVLYFEICMFLSRYKAVTMFIDDVFIIV